MDTLQSHPLSMDRSTVFSAVIPVFDDWGPVESCLRSFAFQENPPTFEVIIVDDGSKTSGSNLAERFRSSFPIRIIRQSHAGKSIARNSGVNVAIGCFILFTDADCLLDRHCLRILADFVLKHPESQCFQIRISGDLSHLIGKAEHFHLSTIQSEKLDPNGSIRFLGTAGVVVPREFAQESELFDGRAIRAQDTLLLSDLIDRGKLPTFVPEAVIVHDVRLGIFDYLWKGLWTGYMEGRTYEIIESRHIKIRSSMPERIKIAVSMWRNYRTSPRDIFPFAIVVLRQSISFLGFLLYRCQHKVHR